MRAVSQGFLPGMWPVEVTAYTVDEPEKAVIPA
jgi:hypothetical protein